MTNSTKACAAIQEIDEVILSADRIDCFEDAYLYSLQPLQRISWIWTITRHSVTCGFRQVSHFYRGILTGWKEA